MSDSGDDEFAMFPTPSRNVSIDLNNSSDDEPHARKRRKRKKLSKEEQKKKAQAKEMARQQYVLHEKMDGDVLQQCLTLKAQDCERNLCGRKLFKQLKLNKTKEFQCSVRATYMYPEHMADIRSGRVYAFPSLQGLQARLTRLCAGSYYRDIDIRKCAPTCLSHVAENVLKIECPLLKCYVADPESFVQKIRDLHEDLQAVSMDFFKKAFNVVMHGGSYRTVMRDFSIPIDLDPNLDFENFQNEVRSIANTAKSTPRFRELYDVAMSRPNPKASFISFVWQHYEGLALRSLFNFFKNSDNPPGVLKHDGIMVYGSKPIECSVLRSAEQSVFTDMGMRVNLVEKSLRPTADDLEYIRGDRMLYMLKDDNARVQHLLARHAYVHNHVRLVNFRGVSILQPHPLMPGVYRDVHTDADERYNLFFYFFLPANSFYLGFNAISMIPSQIRG